ncbi:MAG: hypothetical protein K8R59_07055 [Thermoanaerobaculales bacterium]|nr:hypothetical protein [Thermoanaerobaculales bacterium]
MRRIFLVFLVTALAVTTAAAGPTTSSVITDTLSALGGRQAFGELGVLRMEISENEQIPGGETNSLKYTAYIDTSLENSRLELPGGIIVVSNGLVGWAIVNGNFDSRKQTPRMAPAMNHQKLFPLLLPFTLDMKQINFSKNVAETNFQGTAAWKFSVSLPKLFFPTPMIAQIWEVFVDRKNLKNITARYFPVQEYIEVQPEGMQFQPKKWTEINGVSLPTEVLVQGIDSKARVTGHTLQMSVAYSIVSDPDPTLFVAPQADAN